MYNIKIISKNGLIDIIIKCTEYREIINQAKNEIIDLKGQIVNLEGTIQIILIILIRIFFIVSNILNRKVKNLSIHIIITRWYKEEKRWNSIF